MAINVALIDPLTNECVNVIVAASIEHAQKQFPEYDCVIRNQEMLEPQALIVGDKLIRAADVDDKAREDAKQAAPFYKTGKQLKNEI